MTEPLEDLDAAWGGVPLSPSIPVLDPIEQLKRLFRGAIAANPALWRSVDLEAATTKLEELARARPTPEALVPLEPVLAILVRLNAPKRALQESILAFVDEAREVGQAVALPRTMAALNDAEKKALLRSFYDRLKHGGVGASARQDALAGSIVVFSLPPRSRVLVNTLAVVGLVGALTLLLDDTAADPGPRPSGLLAPSSGLPCLLLHTHGSVLRCTVASDALSSLSPSEWQARFDETRRFARAQNFEDLLVINETGLPVVP